MRAAAPDAVEWDAGFIGEAPDEGRSEDAVASLGAIRVWLGR